MPPSLEFVFADNSGRPSAADRVRIRNRCMQGKNKREGSRRSLREARRRETISKQAIAAKVPPAPPADMALVPLAADVGPQSRELLFKVFSCKALGEAMAPLEKCVDFPAVETSSFDWLFKDASYLHALLLTSSMMYDHAYCSVARPTDRTHFHLRQTISLLNDKLREPGAHQSDSTLYVVITLAVLAAVFGDWQAANAHTAGLHRIVQLRGGLKYLRQRPKLHFKLDRIDLALVLSSGSNPYFQPGSISWSPLFPRKERPIKSDQKLFSIDGIVEERLAIIFKDLQSISITINENQGRSERWSGKSFQTAMSSIQTRLLHLRYDDEARVAECLRLGMLAFLTTMFTVPGRNVPYTHMAMRLKQLFPVLDHGRHPTLRLWILMIAIIAVPNIEEHWTTQNSEVFSDVPTLDWEEAKLQLLGVLWIECIHNIRGQRTFEGIKSQIGNRCREAQ